MPSLLERLLGRRFETPEEKRKREEREAKLEADLRAARLAAAKQKVAEDAAAAKLRKQRDDTDTSLRKVERTTEAISDVIEPKDGKSVAEMALEEVERDRSAASVARREK